MKNMENNKSNESPLRNSPVRRVAVFVGREEGLISRSSAVGRVIDLMRQDNRVQALNAGPENNAGQENNGPEAIERPEPTT